MSEAYCIGTYGLFPENEIIPDITEIGTRGVFCGMPSLSAGANLDHTVDILTDLEATVDLLTDCEHTIEGLI